MSWEITSSKGLNHVIHYPTRVNLHFACLNLKDNEFQEKFLYNVGQSDPNPPLHLLHKDINAGEILRINSFNSLFEISFLCGYKGNKYLIEYKAVNDELYIKIAQKAVKDPSIIPYLIFKDERIRISKPLASFVAMHNKITEIQPYGDLIQSNKNKTMEEIIKICVHVNTCRDTSSGLLYIPVNRAWIEMMSRLHSCDNFSGPLLFIWDAAFNSLLAAQFNKDLAESNLKLLFQQQEKNGKLCQLRIGGKLNNLTGLPIVSFVVWKIYEKWRNIEFLEYIYPKLVLWHKWLKANRDKNGDGLLEWGCDCPKYSITITGKEAGFYESGMDDSPMFEEAEWDENLNCFKMNCVDFSSIFALDSLILHLMSRELKREDASDFFLSEYESLKKAINENLWDKERKLYLNRHWNGYFSYEISPTSFYPMVARIPSEEMARELVKNLLDENLFWGEYVVPSISKRSKYYNPDGDYWRGRIWPPINYLVYEGLKNYDLKISEIFKEKCKNLFLQEWNSDGHIHENYSALTGKGEPQKGVYARSCPFYTWGGLLALIGIDN